LVKKNDEMKKKRRDYSKIKYDDIPQKVEPERVRIKSRIIINRDEFKKTSHEKELLKLAKRKFKNDTIRKAN
jgi:hypothetical protein